VKALVFDLDGTLIDSARDITAAVNAAMRALGRPEHPIAAVHAMIGHGARFLVASALATDDEALIERGRAAFMAYYEAHPIDHTRPYPGVVEMLEALRDDGCALAVATNKPALMTRLVIERLGLDRAGIIASASADEVPRRKPDPAVLHLALARAGADAAIAYVGDMGVDVATARAAGVPAVAVAWGLAPKDARAAKADVWVERPSELLERVREWRKARP